MQKEILESLEDIGSGPIGDSPFVLKKKNNDKKNKKEEDAMSKARESHLVVAALIATVTFAAAFTLPGGYNSDRGTAILAKKTSFKIFVIADTISLMLSILAIFIHFFISLIHGIAYVKDEKIDEVGTTILFGVASILTMTGMITMIIAFIMGICAVLEPSLELAIYLIGQIVFILMYFVCRYIRKYNKY